MCDLELCNDELKSRARTSLSVNDNLEKNYDYFLWFIKLNYFLDYLLKIYFQLICDVCQTNVSF